MFCFRVQLDFHCPVVSLAVVPDCEIREGLVNGRTSAFSEMMLTGQAKYLILISGTLVPETWEAHSPCLKRHTDDSFLTLRHGFLLGEEEMLVER